MGEFLEYINGFKLEYGAFSANSMPQVPKVSVIIPSYNSEKYIEKCLVSLIKQSLKELEIIVVDDGSNDNTWSIIQAFCSLDKRIISIKQENKKQGAARNRGLELARGEFIGFVDSDDWIDENYFETLYCAALRNSADIAAASILKHKSFFKKYNLRYKKNSCAVGINSKIKLCQDNTKRFFNVWNKIYKRELLSQNDIKFPEEQAFEDVLFSAKAIFCANKIISCAKTNYHYLKNPASTINSNKTQKQKDHILAYKQLQDFAKQNNIVLPERLNYITNFQIFPFIKIYKGRYKMKALLFGVLPIFKKNSVWEF